MELAIEARWVLRLLLTLVMLYSHIAAGQAPGSDMVGDTFMDDEDVNIGEGKTSVSIIVDMTSKIKLNNACHEEKDQEKIKTQLKAKLIAALGEDCKCQLSESIIDTDKIECMTDPIVRYTGQISDWSSPKYTVEQLSKFINSWRAVIEVDFNEIVKFSFNITNSHTIVEELGSGDGGPDPEDGSGEIVTIEDSISGDGDGKDEEDKDLANVGGLVSGELRLQVVGYFTALCIAALALLLSSA